MNQYFGSLVNGTHLPTFKALHGNETASVIKLRIKLRLYSALLPQILHEAFFFSSLFLTNCLSVETTLISTGGSEYFMSSLIVINRNKK